MDPECDVEIDPSRQGFFLRSLAAQTAHSYGRERVSDALAKALNITFPFSFYVSAQLLISPNTLVSVRNLRQQGHCSIDLLTTSKSLAGRVTSTSELAVVWLNERCEGITDACDLYDMSQSLGGGSAEDGVGYCVAVCCPLIWASNWEAQLKQQCAGNGVSASVQLMDQLRDNAMCKCIGSMTVAFRMNSADHLERCIKNLTLLCTALAPIIVYHSQNLLQDMALVTGVMQYGNSYDYIPGVGWLPVAQPTSGSQAGQGMEPGSDGVVETCDGTGEPSPSECCHDGESAIAKDGTISACSVPASDVSPVGTGRAVCTVPYILSGVCNLCCSSSSACSCACGESGAGGAGDMSGEEGAVSRSEDSVVKEVVHTEDVGDQQWVMGDGEVEEGDGREGGQEALLLASCSAESKGWSGDGSRAWKEGRDSTERGVAGSLLPVVPPECSTLPVEGMALEHQKAEDKEEMESKAGGCGSGSSSADDTSCQQMIGPKEMRHAVGGELFGQHPMWLTFTCTAEEVRYCQYADEQMVEFDRRFALLALINSCSVCMLLLLRGASLRTWLPLTMSEMLLPVLLVSVQHTRWWRGKYMAGGHTHMEFLRVMVLISWCSCPGMWSIVPALAPWLMVGLVVCFAILQLRLPCLLVCCTFSLLLDVCHVFPTYCSSWPSGVQQLNCQLGALGLTLAATLGAISLSRSMEQARRQVYLGLRLAQQIVMDDAPQATRASQQ